MKVPTRQSSQKTFHSQLFILPYSLVKSLLAIFELITVI